MEISIENHEATTKHTLLPSNKKPGTSRDFYAGLFHVSAKMINFVAVCKYLEINL